MAAIAVGEREIVLQRDGAVVKAERFLEFALVEQRNAEIAQRAGIIGIERDGAATGFDRLVDAGGEPAHLAEIGMIKRHVRISRDSAAQMIDRLGGLARLVGDNAEHVRGLGIVRLGSGGATRQLVGVGQKSMAALLLGERHKCCVCLGLSHGRLDYHAALRLAKIGRRL